MKEDRKIKNVVLIMLDTLQFNYLGCYGNKVVKTPNIDRLARQGFLFENAYSEGLPTVPVRRALMTGRFTLPYGGWQPLAPDDTTVADIMWGKNMQTALVYDPPPMRLPKYGYSRGFDFVSFNPGQELDHTSFADVPLDPALKPEDYTSPTMVFNEKGEVIDDDSTQLLDEIGCFLRQQQFRKPEDSYISRVMTDAQNWLSNRRDKTRPFLLWVDSFDPHEPWDPESVWKGEPCPYDPEYVGNPLVLAPWTPIEGRITERECEHIRALYMEKITQVDKWVGELLDSIRAQGLWDETLIVLMSDHGQPMGEGEHGHGIMRKCRPWPYEELAHIPMIMRGPGLPRNRRVRGFVQSCDVAPTVVDWLGIGVHPSMQGHSLLPLAKGDVEKVREFAIAGYFRYSWSIITEDWSFIHWLKDDEKSVADARFGIYGKDLGESTAHILQMKKANAVEDRDTAFYNRAYEEHKKAATLDGEDQWTCTAAASSEVPARDELYCRKDDPFQLNNVSAKHPEVAKELFEQLKLFMAELRAS